MTPKENRLYREAGKDPTTTRRQTNGIENQKNKESEINSETRDHTPDSLINSLKQLNLKPPINVEGTRVYRLSEELDKQWEKAPYLTVVMDDDTTKNFIQELLDIALIFYFSSNSPQFRAFTDWAE
jgi:hypothetical protein